MGKIKAIPTKYDGCTFLSRSEARFAMFFNELNIEYRYEDDGYSLNAGWCLPDFYLPKQKIYAEVKGEDFTHIEHLKCKQLALLTKRQVIELTDRPSIKPILIITPVEYYWCPICCIREYKYYSKEDKERSCKKGHIFKEITELNENKGHILIDKYGWIKLYIGTDIDHNDYPNIINAITKANSVRF